MRKNVLQYQVANDKSLATSFVSDPTIIKFLDNCSYQINITTSDSSGTFAVEASNDYSYNQTTNSVINPGTWVAVDLEGGIPYAAGANDSILIDLNQLPFNAIRVKYTSSVAGTGTCDIFLNAKQLS